MATTEGATLLLLAASHGHAMVVDSLVEAGADTNLATTKGTTPLMVASLNGHALVVQVKPRIHF